jgi:hypothetical protein
MNCLVMNRLSCADCRTTQRVSFGMTATPRYATSLSPGHQARSGKVRGNRVAARRGTAGMDAGHRSQLAAALMRRRRGRAALRMVTKTPLRSFGVCLRPERQKRAETLRYAYGVAQAASHPGRASPIT